MESLGGVGHPIEHTHYGWEHIKTLNWGPLAVEHKHGLTNGTIYL